MSKQQEVVINVIESELSKFKIGWFLAYDALKGMVALYGADKVQEALTEIIGDGNARMEHYFITQPDVVFPENWFCAKCGEYFTHPNHIHSRDCLCKTCEQKRLLTPRAADDCPRGGSHVYKWDGTLPTDEMVECEKCGHRR